MSGERSELSDARGELLRTNGLLVAPRFELDDVEDQIDILDRQRCPHTFDLVFKKMAALKRVREAELQHMIAVNNYFKIKQALEEK